MQQRTNHAETLRPIFDPECVAVVGASDQPDSVGHAVYSNLKAAGYGGTLIPVNSRHRMIQGDVAFKSLSDANLRPDLVVVCTPAATVPAIARECGQLGVGGMVVISAGFREIGAAGQSLEAEVKCVLQQYPTLRLIGPNCLGVLAPYAGLNASFSATMPRNGGLAVISQSGALCTAILDWSRDREVGFSGIVSVGNMLDVGFGDLIDYFAADDHTSALLLYIESLTEPYYFIEAAQRCSRKKPIIALKSGRFAESSHAASSHTGAMAGVDAVYDAAFRRAGIERVFSFDDLFDCAKLLESRREPAGPRLAIVTNAGGPGIMASDAWLAQRGQMAVLSPQTINALNQVLPTHWSHGNPIDVLGDAGADRYAVALRIVAADASVDSLIVILTPQSMTDSIAIAETVAAYRQRTDKPILAVWMGGPAVREGRRILEAAGIPVYVTPEQAALALAHLVSASRLREQLRQPALPDQFSAGCDDLNEVESVRADTKLSKKWQARLSQATGLLGEVLTKELLSDYSVPVVPTYTAHSSIEAAVLAMKVGFPVVLKILSPDISHKTDVGGVVLNLPTTDAVEAAYRQIMDSVAQNQPLAQIDGVTVQSMVSASRGVELLLGSTCDPIFGPVLVVGSGGITTEIQHDLVMQLLPLDKQLIQSMLQGLRIYPILEGYRGRPGVDLSRLVDVIAKFARLVASQPGIQSIEINPLLADANSVIALDARVIMKSAT